MTLWRRTLIICRVSMIWQMVCLFALIDDKNRIFNMKMFRMEFSTSFYRFKLQVKYPAALTSCFMQKSFPHRRSISRVFQLSWSMNIMPLVPISIDITLTHNVNFSPRREHLNKQSQGMVNRLFVSLRRYIICVRNMQTN